MSSANLSLTYRPPPDPVIFTESALISCTVPSGSIFLKLEIFSFRDIEMICLHTAELQENERKNNVDCFLFSFYYLNYYLSKYDFLYLMFDDCIIKYFSLISL